MATVSRDHSTLVMSAGAKFMVGFVTEDGVPVNNEISTGASAVFPVGVHPLL